MQIEYSDTEEPPIEKFYIKKYIEGLGETYSTITTTFRRSFPFGYPGLDGERAFKHTWKTRQGNTYYQYFICRHCFDVRKSQSTVAPEKVVQTCLCAPCGANAVRSRKYWDEMYTALCSCSLLGNRFEHCMEWKLSRFNIDYQLPKVGSIRLGGEIQEDVRDNSEIEQVFSSDGSDSASYSIQTL